MRGVVDSFCERPSIAMLDSLMRWPETPGYGLLASGTKMIQSNISHTSRQTGPDDLRMCVAPLESLQLSS